MFRTRQMLSLDAVFQPFQFSQPVVRSLAVERCGVSMGCGASVGKDPAGSDRNLIVPLESKIERCVFV